MSKQTKLPPGQYELDKFPRFGLSQFANRFPKKIDSIELKITGDVKNSLIVSEELKELPRVSQTSDFHCVTTWTKRSLEWSGFRFLDFFEKIVVPKACPQKDATFVILRCQDGYMSSLPLADLLANTVILADRLDDNPLTIEHGAPLRLVAPEHYGYKNAKHLKGIEFWVDERKYYSSAFKFMDHPRARVALEERGRGVPGWLLRYLYRPLVRPGIWQFKRAMENYLNRGSKD